MMCTAAAAAVESVPAVLESQASDPPHPARLALPLPPPCLLTSLQIVCDGMYSGFRRKLTISPSIHHPSFFIGLLLKVGWA